MKRYDVAIIGAGATGCALVRDLKLRGFKVALIERNKHICSETSLNNHRTVLTGMRYVVKDFELARECWNEHKILHNIAPDCIAKIRNFYVLLNKEEDIKYAEQAIKNAKKIGIPCDEVPLNSAFNQVPSLNRKMVCKAYEIPERSMIWVVNYLKKCITDVDDFYGSCKILSFGIKSGRIETIKFNNAEISADFVVNATGPWANYVTQKVGINIPMVYNQGSILVLKSQSTLSIHVLRMPQDWDAYLNYGKIALLGTTSTNIESPNDLKEEPDLEKRMKMSFNQVMPEITQDKPTKVIRAVRPLVSNKNKEGRNISRSYYLIDHTKDGIDNLITITGGKMSLARLMAEKTVNLICKKVGSHAKCQTHIKKI